MVSTWQTWRAPQDAYSEPGSFRRAIVSSKSNGYWVETDAGPHYWDGNDGMTALSEEASMVIATDDDQFLGLSLDGHELIRGRF